MRSSIFDSCYDDSPLVGCISQDNRRSYTGTAPEVRSYMIRHATTSFCVYIYHGRFEPEIISPQSYASYTKDCEDATHALQMIEGWLSDWVSGANPIATLDRVTHVARTYA